jgi:hypothetical protein
VCGGPVGGGCGGGRWLRRRPVAAGSSAVPSARLAPVLPPHPLFGMLVLICSEYQFTAGLVGTAP